MPSEPIRSRSGLGPAPEPGRRRLSQGPRGVSARTDSTKSSMCVWSVAKCPPARVAIQPPSVEYSKDWGKWRRVSPCSLELSLEARPGGAGLDAGGARDRVDLEHPVERPQVDRDRAGVGLGLQPRLDPAHHAGAAAEGDRRRSGLLAPGQHPLQLRLAGRVGHHVRGMVEAASKRPHQVPVGAAVGVQGALVGVAAADGRERRRRLEAGRRQLQVLQAAAVAGPAPGRTRGAPGRRPRSAPPGRTGAAGPRSPSPRTCAGGSRSWRSRFAGGVQ